MLCFARRRPAARGRGFPLRLWDGGCGVTLHVPRDGVVLGVAPALIHGQPAAALGQ
jgi:hypothetical protein